MGDAEPELIAESIDEPEAIVSGTLNASGTSKELMVGFERVDRATIFGLAIILTTLMVAFFLYVQWQDLISFDLNTSKTMDDYFHSALVYRERRLALILTYRTFLTGFGFTVGVVLSAIGGIFILRRATVQFSASGDMNNSDSSPLKAASLSLGTNSPGVLFMVGGVVVMVVTQWLALPVGAPEIFPTNSQPTCSADQIQNGTCQVSGTNWQQIEHLCESKPEMANCIALRELINVTEE
jgi:hypothetical protein